MTYNQLTTEIFIERCKKLYGEKYDYSLVEYKNYRTKVKIICNNHNYIFEQYPTHFFRKIGGCPICSGLLRNDANGFINKSKIIHNEKYDYSLVEYKNNITKVKIICPIHGVFEQIPKNHKKGIGCYKCNGGVQLTTSDFIEKSKKIHGNKYDYSLVKYEKSNKKIKIICTTHGIFEQTPNNHLNGNGCSKCIRNYNVTKNEFIYLSKNIYKDEYDYSSLIFKNMMNKVTLICKKHGEFKIIPTEHIHQKRGCPICKLSKGELEIKNVLEIHNIKYERQKKFEKCKHKDFLKFDFYLPEYNIYIEYDGLQHYKPIDIWGGEKNLLENIKRDKIKTNFCKENNINLLRISYKDNIEEKLKWIKKK